MAKPRAPLPDQAARDLITSRLDLNLLVEAGAGSGKTHSLASRMTAGIAAGRYKVEEMAAVTFTRKAAAELRGCFQLALEERLKSEKDEHVRARIRAALGGLERLFTGTIHSFFAHLLRERPVEAELAPGFTELDEAEDVTVRRRAWRDFLARARERESAVLRELTEAGVRPADLDSAFDTICTFEEVTFPPGDAKPPDPKPAWAGLDRFWKKLAAKLPEQIPDDTTCDIQQKARTSRWLIREARRDRPANLVRILRLWEGEPVFRLYQWPGSPKEQRQTRDEVMALLADLKEKTVGPFLLQWRQYLYRLAVTLLVEGREFARDARAQANTLNYNDLLQKAARLLRGNAGVLSALQQKYRWLFVDEFQDTDPIQADVILLLAGEPLRPGALFIVGDPKQSIYRFRRADIQIYNRVRGMVEQTGGMIVPLTTTFRALPDLCSWANEAFTGAFPGEATPHTPKFQPLDPVRSAADATLKGLDVGVRALTAPSGLRKREDVIDADAAAIARSIRSAIDSGRRTAGDFLVLTWKKDGLPRYAAALEALQIPIEVSGASAFGDSEPVATLAVLLRALGDPDDEAALVGVLRGPLFGISDADLYAHKQAGGRFSLWAGVSGHPCVIAALSSLADMRRLTRELPVPAAVERILEITGHLALAAATKPGGADAGDLLNAIDCVRHVVEDGGTLADAADALDESITEADVESVPLEPGRRDVVRLMNLHKAKGLEAPVVFLADPGGGWESEAELRIVREEEEPRGYFKIIRKEKDKTKKWKGQLIAEPPGWEEHAALEQPFLEAEADRLRYVAATRARDLLVVSRLEADKLSKHQYAPFEPFLVADKARPGFRGELVVPKAVEAPPAGKQDLSAKTRARLSAERDARLDHAKAASFTVESVTGLTHRDVVVGEEGQVRILRGPATGIEWGDLIHALLEHAMRRPESSRAGLERLARWLTVENAELRGVLSEALDAVDRVRASEMWQRALAAEECHVEVPIAVTQPGADGRPVVLTGVIDLAFRTPDGWHVVDYKSDQLASPDGRELTGRYRAQLDAYAAAWKKILPSVRVTTGLHAVRAGTTAWREPNG
ncbi:MAG: UvrD-helicase domain-containing protein [Planctomycetes bacterium]|nr:UvrD-helicase domain-containing protein [Planctomycetota bacterium]